MTDAKAIEAATKRLQLALDGLEAAAERRLEYDRAHTTLAGQVQAFDSDRSRLAAELDTAAARARQLETTSREVARRLDEAIETIRPIIATPDR